MLDYWHWPIAILALVALLHSRYVVSKYKKNGEILVPGATVLCHLGRGQYTRRVLGDIIRGSDGIQWTVWVGGKEIIFPSSAITLEVYT